MGWSHPPNVPPHNGQNTTTATVHNVRRGVGTVYRDTSQAPEQKLNTTWNSACLPVCRLSGSFSLTEVPTLR
ncbi:hypothetical protein DPEC_G00288770 [Dallia pectoralis]|uniref:Uncharacterized protein n=1 Tax=Dallia pectoralis TaxID=75939 RepID=A0ACC2FKZ6_DALPE|nr:hypothetical protein DPEC_G00288770 [Dallia pectoralis]